MEGVGGSRNGRRRRKACLRREPRSFKGTQPVRVEPGPSPRGRDDGQGDDSPEPTVRCGLPGTGPAQRIRRSHTRRTPSAQTTPPAIEIGTPSQKPQPAQLASHHDMRSPNSVTAAINASEPMYSHRTNRGRSDVRAGHRAGLPVGNVTARASTDRSAHPVARYGTSCAQAPRTPTRGVA